MGITCQFPEVYSSPLLWPAIKPSKIDGDNFIDLNTKMIFHAGGTHRALRREFQDQQKRSGYQESSSPPKTPPLQSIHDVLKNRFKPSGDSNETEAVFEQAPAADRSHLPSETFVEQPEYLPIFQPDEVSLSNNAHQLEDLKNLELSQHYFDNAKKEPEIVPEEIPLPSFTAPFQSAPQPYQDPYSAYDALKSRRVTFPTEANGIWDDYSVNSDQSQFYRWSNPNWKDNFISDIENPQLNNSAQDDSYNQNIDGNYNYPRWHNSFYNSTQENPENPYFQQLQTSNSAPYSSHDYQPYFDKSQSFYQGQQFNTNDFFQDNNNYLKSYDQPGDYGANYQGKYNYPYQSHSHPLLYHGHDPPYNPFTRSSERPARKSSYYGRGHHYQSKKPERKRSHRRRLDKIFDAPYYNDPPFPQRNEYGSYNRMYDYGLYNNNTNNSVQQGKEYSKDNALWSHDETQVSNNPRDFSNCTNVLDITSSCDSGEFQASKTCKQFSDFHEQEPATTGHLRSNDDSFMMFNFTDHESPPSLSDT